jgi:hypothetical protein
MKTNTTLKKNLYGILLSLLTPMVAQADAVLYQQDFSYLDYSDNTPAETAGWSGSYATIGGGPSWGNIMDQGTGTGLMLTVISGWTHNLTLPISTNATKIVVKSLMFPQAGIASVGLYSGNFNTSPSWNGDGWSGTGPTMNFSGGNFSLTRSVNAGQGSSAAVAVPGVVPGSANFSMVIDVTTGLADGYFGSPETGTLLVSGFDLKGTQTLSQFQSDLLANSKIGVKSNQGLFDSLSVEEILEPLPPVNQPDVTVYQQDFSSYSSPTSAEAGGWSGSYATIGGSPNWGSIENMGTTTGNLLWVISGWTHNLTTGFTGNETQITVQALMFPQVGSASVGLYSGNFNTSPSWNGDGWSGTGPTMNFSGGNFSLTRSVNAGQGSSNSRAILGVTHGNAVFSMVIDVTTGLADGYFGSPETGTLLIKDFDLKGTQTLSQFRADLLSNSKIGVRSNQGLFDNITVATVSPEFSTFASWSAAFAGGQTADLDYDNDGVPNGVEYFMNAASGFTANPGLVGNTVTWPNGGKIPSTGYGTQFVVQTSSDLVTWEDVTDGDMDQNGTNTASSLSYTLDPANNPGKQFVRLKVTPN